ncbi:chorismate mutase [Sinobacterium caligoides]|uniref:Bifunctional chorismate mutase/prephenate dehydratase n=1 Tax=Sinobacterium caligoides TaxID=933926 RepID=A0A3N2DZ36_9GAMM|nr:prephenate dehydratase [Sinobacterium caligoides]ROS05136.1 chorismate mutase [Sinobacterium caligoides]
MVDSSKSDCAAEVPSLAELRDSIDSIDRQIHQLINQRAVCAQRVADAKFIEFEAAKADGRDPEEVLFYRPEREAQVLRKVMERNDGPLEGRAVAHIFREIMSACLALEKPMQVAYLGPEGTFTQAAAVKHFGHAVIPQPQQTIASVFGQVESGECNYGVVPVENSTEGMVTHTLDSFINSSLKICGEVELRIELNLMAQSGVKIEQVKTIVAHQQALAQSRLWLDKHWPHVERVAVSSNGEGAKMAAADPSVAAVAGVMAQEEYNLVSLSSGIEDFSNNTTRFLIIGREAVGSSGADKTSIAVTTRNKPGALFNLLQPFQDAGVMLTRIDTRPSRTETWTYVFFMEFEGHVDDSDVKGIMEQIREQSVVIKHLGSYPKAAL